jgi:hypothetical protein
VVARLIVLGALPDDTRSATDHDGTLGDLRVRALRAEQQVRELQERLGLVEAELARAQAGDDSSQRVYALVGLHPSCPDFILKVVHRAFRKEFHPDALSDRPREEQLAAQERFKAYEQIFTSIDELRGGS